MNPTAKPLLRGYFHQAAFFISLIAGGLLIAQCDDPETFLPVILYSLSLAGLFGVSALYHRVHWAPHQRTWMRRLDHSFIFILIWGTATPVAFLALSQASGAKFFIYISVAAGAGVAQSLFWVKAPKWIAVVLYLFVGWLVVPYVPELKHALGSERVLNIFIGGLIYSLGALIYAMKRPNPWPQRFGYHEIFHILVIIAAAFHWVVILSLLTGEVYIERNE